MAQVEIFKLGLEADQFLNAAVKIQEEIDRILVKQKLMGKRTKENGKEFISLSTALKANKTELNKTKKAIIALESPYKKLASQLIRTRDKAKDLAVQFGEDSRQARRAATEVRKLDNRLKRIDKSLGQSQRNVGNYGSAIKGISARFIGWGLAIAGAIRVLRDMFKRIREFDKAMVGLSAILGVSRSSLSGLEDAIKDIAGASIKTSNEVAELATTLATLGKSKSEIIQLLKPVNDLSIALGATSEEAGQLLVKTLNAFGASGQSALKYADIIAKMRTSTALDFEQIKDSLGFLAPVAKVAGLSFEETGAILGVLVDNGIKAARAGRLMSTSFLRLAKDGKTVEAALNEINQAQAEGLIETDLLAVSTNLFGVQSAALGIILASNRDRVAELTEELENSGGALKELTDKQLESIDAKLKIVDSSWEKFILSLEDGNSMMGKFVKGALDQFAFAFERFGFFMRDDLSLLQRMTIAINTMSRGMAAALPFLGDSVVLFDDMAEKLVTETKAREKSAQAIADQREEFIRLNKTLAPLAEDQEQRNTQLMVFGLELLEGNEQQKKDFDKRDLSNFEESQEEKQALIDAWNTQHLKDLDTFLKDKIKLEDDLELQATEGRIEKQKLKIQQKLKADLKELEALTISKEEKTELEALLNADAENRLNDLEEKRLLAFENRKRDLLNEIELAKAETDQEKEEILLQQEFEKNELALERLELTEQEHTELLLLLTNDRNLQLKVIQDKFDTDKSKKRDLVNKKEIEAEKLQASEREKVANFLTGVLIGALGNTLAAKLAGIVIQGAVEAGLVSIASASSQASNLARATAVGPPQNIPLIVAANVQNVAMGAVSKAAIKKIILATALTGAGAGVGGLFAGGGMLQGDDHSRGGIPFRIGGRSGFEAEGGEAILNKRSMSNPFLRSLASQINEAGGGVRFAEGGLLNNSIDGSISEPLGITSEQINDFIDGKIATVRVVNVATDTLDVAQDVLEVENLANL